MSRTKRDRNNRKACTEKLHDGKLQKLGKHKTGMGHKNLDGKMLVGPGGINCSCCNFKTTKATLKTKHRRHERHTFDFSEIFDEVQNSPAYIAEMKLLEKEEELCRI